MRGHGDSERPSGGYRIADMADDVMRLMDALNVPKAVLIGHSMGSFVARKVFELAPDKVSRLVLVGGALRCNNDVVRELQRVVNELTDPVDEAFVRDFQMSTLATPVPAPFLEAVIANSRRMPARIWKARDAGADRVRAGRGAARTFARWCSADARMRCSPAPSRWCSRASFRAASSISWTASVTRSTGSSRRCS